MEPIYLKWLKQSFKVFKPEFLKATSFKDETKLYSKIVFDTFWLSKIFI